MGGLETVLFPVVIAVALVEVIMILAWVPAYFRIGIPLFRRQRAVPRGLGALPTQEELEKSLERGGSPDLLFRPLGNGQYAFREVFSSFSVRLRYTPVMHGRLTFDREAGTVTAHGLANIWCLLFTAAWMPHFLQPNKPQVLAFAPLALFGLIYLVQVKKYFDAAKVGASLWEASGDPAQTPAEAQDLAAEGPEGASHSTSAVARIDGLNLRLHLTILGGLLLFQFFLPVMIGAVNIAIAERRAESEGPDKVQMYSSEEYTDRTELAPPDFEIVLVEKDSDHTRKTYYSASGGVDQVVLKDDKPVCLTGYGYGMIGFIAFPVIGLLLIAVSGLLGKPLDHAHDVGLAARLRPLFQLYGIVLFVGSMLTAFAHVSLRLKGAG